MFNCLSCLTHTSPITDLLPATHRQFSEELVTSNSSPSEGFPPVLQQLSLLLLDDDPEDAVDMTVPVDSVMQRIRNSLENVVQELEQKDFRNDLSTGDIGDNRLFRALGKTLRSQHSKSKREKNNGDSVIEFNDKSIYPDNNNYGSDNMMRWPKKRSDHSLEPQKRSAGISYRNEDKTSPLGLGKKSHFLPFLSVG